ncbi:hypothetical protein BUALT_Bualt01G0192600 [Buddleja alternifolia]|uniref:MULE transposase domain-containing protein n=1 Tax=Buddleja alternifolia TaxID=168488 RepID=A0AAV6YJ84_9LAMI|nr:hypothetical protein BUALT_Bualt01G0192600 [Buddleja alternifolia]
MVLPDYVDFYVWVGGRIEWFPTVKYFGGSKMVFPNVDKEFFYLSDLMNMYVKSGGKCTFVAIYYCLPGHSLDNGIRLLDGDKGVIELIRAYNGKNIIPIYFEEIAAPLLIVDTQGAVINNDESLLALPPPEITNINQPIDLDNEYDGDDENQLNNYNLGVEKEIDNMSTDENFENNEDDDFENEYLDFVEDLNWENKTIENLNNEHEVVENLNNEPEDVENLNNKLEEVENLNNEGENEAAKNLNNAENVNTEFQEGRVPRFRAEQQEEQFYERNFNNDTEGWCSDVNDDDEFRSLRGSDDDNEVYEVWNDDRARRKGLFKGQLLCAVGRDKNNNLYPIALALVEVEKFDTWKWFLDLLIRDIGSAEEKDWAFLSDRQKGLIDVVHSVAPRAEHRFCVRHLYKNFKGRFKGEELKKLFWKAASTYSVKQHLRIMKQIERLHPKRGAQQTPYEWMSEKPAQHCARYPCCHALSCIALMREEINDYVDDCFKKDAYLKVYNHDINPVPGILDYEDSGLGVVDPPHVRIMPGRPKKVRRMDANDIRGQTNVSRRGLTHTHAVSVVNKDTTRMVIIREQDRLQQMMALPKLKQKMCIYHIYASHMPSQFAAEDSNEVPPPSSQTRTPNEVPPQRRRKAATQPRRQTTSAKGKQVASQGPITAPQASYHSKFQSSQFSTQFLEIPQQLQRHTPKSRKQAIPVSLSSRKIQKMRHVLNPIPNPSNPAFKRPAASSSVQSMLKQVYASYNPKVASTQPSSMAAPASSSKLAPTSTSMTTTSKSDVVRTVGTPKKQ